MRILSFTGGASGMYCGTCLRDNALAAELIRQGHDVLLVPMYTPTLTDERNVSQDRVFFSGINVYLQQHYGLFRNAPRLLDKLFDSRWLLNAATSRSIPTDPRLLGELTVSMLRGENGHLRKEFSKLLDWVKTEPPPDVIDLPYTLVISFAGPLRRALGRPVCCTLQGEDLFLQQLHEPWRSESLKLIRASLDQVDVFIAVSHYYADFMSEFIGIPRSRIEVAPLGINLNGHSARERTPDGKFRIGYFARVAPEKGLHILVEAFRKANLPDAMLDAAGYLPAEHKPFLERLQQELKSAGFEQRFRYHGALSREKKIEFLQGLDVFSVPSTYAEPKGLFLLEAMANGIPVVQPDHGAYPEILNRTGGGLLVAPNRPDALAAGLRELYDDRAQLSKLAGNAIDGVRRHYSIAAMAARTLEVYSSVVRPASLGAKGRG